MAIKKMPIGLFVQGLKDAEARHDGYIWGAKGEDPKQRSESNWFFTQYKDEQRTKALYWREHAERVWDCNGLAEGLYQDYAGVSINTAARYNYSGWCSVKGSGVIPVEHRVPGAAIFVYSSSAGYITHVGYLEEPVDPSDPAGDWYVIEARGVMHGVVRTNLYTKSSGWNRWGLMTKYFDYTEQNVSEVETGSLKNGSEGDAVKSMQESLIRLGYNCGKYGADGDFGDATEQALRKFQTDEGLTVSGVYNRKTAEALDAAIAELNTVVKNPTKVKIVNGQCYIRTKPSTSGDIVGTAKNNSVYKYAGTTAENGWNSIICDDEVYWVSGKYSKLI